MGKYQIFSCQKTSLREDHNQRFSFLQSGSILWSIELEEALLCIFTPDYWDQMIYLTVTSL